MRRRWLPARGCALMLAVMATFASPASGGPQDTTLDAQIEHGAAGCADAPADKKAFGLIPPGFDYRFTATGTADAHPVNDMHLKLASGWEMSFRKRAVPGANVSEVKRELRVAGSKASAWLLAAESQIEEFLSVYKSGKAVTYEVALLGCTGNAGAVDAIMALKEFEVETD